MLYVDRPASHPPERENFRSVREMYSDDGYTVLRTSLKIGRALGVMLSFAGPLLAFGCSKDSASTSVAFTPDVPVAFVANPILRVYHNPYALVDWATSERLLAQHHDHFDTLRSIVAYDNAGYDVISYMNYSGLASASYSWRERRWPVSSWLPADFEKGLRHLKLFIPDGEEVGYQHVTSSFMTRYIAKNEAGYAQPPGTIMYGGANLSNTEGTQTEIDAINIAGGFPIISHPWTGWSEYQKLEGYKGVEIYNAYVAWKAEDGSDPYFVPDRNFVMQGIWDQMLMRDQTIIGIAVNDHFGPNNNDKNLSDRVRDSGKILVMAEHATLDAYTAAFTRGSLFAIQDAGAKKGNYPVITSISEDTTALTITLASDDATVQWIANGAPIAAGAILPMRAIPAGSLYVRAVVTNTAGSRVFTQAFKLRLRGDVDGNGILDAADTMVCAGVKSRLDVNPDHIAACQYR